MKNIKFSILIPVYNQEKLIIKALDSIPRRDDIEVICVDDCSTDNTWEVLQSYDRIPLKIFRNERNLKIGLTRNVLIENASGEYLYGLDSDDWCLTDEFNSFLNTFNYTEDVISVMFKTNDNKIHNKDGDCCAFYTYFIKNKFIKNNDLKCVDTWRAEDWFFKEDLMKCKPSIMHTDKVIYHYNYPREGSITNRWENGIDE